MKSVDDYCEVLGIDPSASPEQFKQAYRDLVKVWHPDRFSHDLRLQRKAEEKLKEINEAYQQLQSFFSNANRRGSRSTNASGSKPAGSQRKPEEPSKPPPKPQAARTQQTDETSPRPDGDATKANENDGSFSSPGLGSSHANAHPMAAWIIIVAAIAIFAIAVQGLQRQVKEDQLARSPTERWQWTGTVQHSDTDNPVLFPTTSVPQPDISVQTYSPGQPIETPSLDKLDTDRKTDGREQTGGLDEIIKQSIRDRTAQLQTLSKGNSNDRPSSGADQEFARSRSEVIKKTQETVEGAEKLLALHEAELKRLTEEYERRRVLYYQGSINRNEVMQAEQAVAQAKLRIQDDKRFLAETGMAVKEFEMRDKLIQPSKQPR